MDARMVQLALQIADDAARGRLLAESVPAKTGGGWMDVAQVPEEAKTDLHNALEYLELRGMLTRHGGTANLVRITDDSRHLN